MIGPISLFIGSVPNGQIYIVLNLPTPFVCVYVLFDESEEKWSGQSRCLLVSCPVSISLFRYICPLCCFIG